MREWLVAGALVEVDSGLLLVQNQRRDGRVDWTPPGGVIDPGESLIEGLTREVNEETGLVVTEWSEAVYEIHAEAPDLGWELRVVVHRAVEWNGQLQVDDPDGIVVDARYVDRVACSPLLADSPLWVRDPLGAWIEQRWESHRAFRYQVLGTHPGNLNVVTVS